MSLPFQETAMPRSLRRAVHSVEASDLAPIFAPAVQFAEAMQAAGRQALDGWVHEAVLARDETSKATAPQEVGTVQAALWGVGLTHAVQVWSGMICAALDAQSAWWNNAEALMQRALEPWQEATAGRIDAGPLLAFHSDGSPWELARPAIDTWLAMNDAWIGALRNDLESAAERTSAD
jgi:hypothetical protein